MFAPHLMPLRLVDSASYEWYCQGLRVLAALGPSRFANGLHDGTLPVEVPPSALSAEYTLYHAWLPGLVQVDGGVARRLRDASLDPVSARLPGELLERVRRLGWLSETTAVDLEKVIDRGLHDFQAAQNRRELASFLHSLGGRRLNTIVEIGTARGGLLYCLSQVSDSHAQVVSIDLPGAPECQAFRHAEAAVFASFGGPSRSVSCIRGDSRDRSTLMQLGEQLHGATIDLLFIDGDHSYDGVRRDFEMYSPLVADDGLIALHDICVSAGEWPSACTLLGDRPDVRRFWNELKSNSAAVEFIDEHGACRPVRRPGVKCAWGIGVIDRGAPASSDVCSRLPT